MNEDDELVLEMRESESDCFHCGSPRQVCSSREEEARSRSSTEERRKSGTAAEEDDATPAAPDWDSGVAASSTLEPPEMTQPATSATLNSPRGKDENDDSKGENEVVNDGSVATCFTPIDKFTDENENNGGTIHDTLKETPIVTRAANLDRHPHRGPSTKPALTILIESGGAATEPPTPSKQSPQRLQSKEPASAMDDGQSVGSDAGGDVDGPPPRLLLVSSKIKNINAIKSALWPHVFWITFRHDLSPDDVLSLVAQELGSTKGSFLSL